MALERLDDKAQEIEKADDESTQKKWAEIRNEAILFLSEKKQRWQRLQDERTSRLTEVTIYVVFVVLVTIVALTSRNTEVLFLCWCVASINDFHTFSNQDAFWLSSGLRGYLQDSEFPPNNISNTEKTFSGITTPAHLSMFE
jgi:hypothetical protein